ncbi:MAG: hypothetical protein COB30_008855 [Ectothiorhodospiraceae bacterium]|nr:hypothetical protein [Ectothiorhodospiraceae bacterium]
MENRLLGACDNAPHVRKSVLGKIELDKAIVMKNKKWGKGVRHVNTVWKTSLLLVWMSSLLACASTTDLNLAADANGVPLWVNEGSSIITSKEGRRFHGVGSAPALGDFSLQTSTADNRAREEITRILASYIEIVSRDFIATGDADTAGFTERVVAKQIEHLSSIDLTGIEVVGHWQDKSSKVIYSIAEVDMRQVWDVLNNNVKLHSGLRGFIFREGDSIFDRIAKTEE